MDSRCDESIYRGANPRLNKDRKKRGGEDARTHVSRIVEHAVFAGLTVKRGRQHMGG